MVNAAVQEAQGRDEREDHQPAQRRGAGHDIDVAAATAGDPAQAPAHDDEAGEE